MWNAERFNPNIIPLSLVRQIGSDDSNQVALQLGDTIPVDTSVAVSNYYICTAHAPADVTRCLTESHKPILVAGDNVYKTLDSEIVALCNTYGLGTDAKAIACEQMTTLRGKQVVYCNVFDAYAMDRMITCVNVSNSDGLGVYDCNSYDLLATEKRYHCLTTVTYPSEIATDCLTESLLQSLATHCYSLETLTSVQSPCEYIDVPLPPPPTPDKWQCWARYDSNKIPLFIDRLKLEHDARAIPLPFSCSYTNTIPNLPSYPMENNVDVTLDGERLDVFTVELKADINSWCWSGSITVSPDSFKLIDLDEKPIVDIDINGFKWRLMLETSSDNRVFANKSFTINGRSESALLSKENASQTTAIIAFERYAQQIASDALQFTDYALVWQVDDWLIPANTYSYGNKSPMAVINDVASACGAYVYTDQLTKTIYVKKRQPMPAWQQNALTPAISLPASVILEISGQKNITERKNGIFVAGQNNGVLANCYRSGTSGEPRLSTFSHPLVTSSDCAYQYAQWALSQTGAHKSESVKLPLTNRYGLDLYALSELIEVQEDTGNWQGYTTSISISVKSITDVSQTITIDRYLDE